MVFTDSDTPRRLSAARARMKRIAMRVGGSVRELGEIVAAEGAGRRARRGQPRAHHHEGDDEGQERDLERLLRVERGTGRLRVLADEFDVRGRCQQRHGEADDERQPQRSADLAGDAAGRGVDPGAEDVADHEEDQQLGADGPVEACSRSWCRSRSRARSPSRARSRRGSGSRWRRVSRACEVDSRDGGFSERVTGFASGVPLYGWVSVANTPLMVEDWTIPEQCVSP